MKFISFLNSKGENRWGLFNATTNKVADLGDLAPSLLAFLEGPWQSQMPSLGTRLEKAQLSLSELQIQACIPRPPSMRDGYAFRQHVEAARRNRGVPMIEEFDHFPVFYFTNHQAVFGPGPIEVLPQHLEQLDFELESAIVIGKKCRNVKASEADQVIFGYTIMNDFSARKLQMEEMKLSLGPAKGKDFATALGPWLVTPDELAPYKVSSPQGDRYALEMSCHINEKEISKGNMKDMTWSYAQIIERASYGVTLYPGDVIGSGTVGTGCFLELNGSRSEKQWLKTGDQISLKITGLGVLNNKIVAGNEKAWIQG